MDTLWIPCSFFLVESLENNVNVRFVSGMSFIHLTGGAARITLNDWPGTVAKASWPHGCSGLRGGPAPQLTLQGLVDAAVSGEVLVQRCLRASPSQQGAASLAARGRRASSRQNTWMR